MIIDKFLIGLVLPFHLQGEPVAFRQHHGRPGSCVLGASRVVEITPTCHIKLSNGPNGPNYDTSACANPSGELTKACMRR